MFVQFTRSTSPEVIRVCVQTLAWARRGLWELHGALPCVHPEQLRFLVSFGFLTPLYFFFLSSLPF